MAASAPQGQLFEHGAHRLRSAACGVEKAEGRDEGDFQRGSRPSSGFAANQSVYRLAETWRKERSHLRIGDG
jgi:hypothetical protein